MPGMVSLAAVMHALAATSPFLPEAHLLDRAEHILQWPSGQIITFHLGICSLNICHVLVSVRTGSTNTEAVCCRGKGAGPKGCLGG